MDFITNKKPSAGYKSGVVLVALLATLLMVFLIVSGTVTLTEGAFYFWLLVSIVFYMAGPVLGRRKEYLGNEPSTQIMRVTLLPYVVFCFLCGGIALYGWLSGV